MLIDKKIDNYLVIQKQIDDNIYKLNIILQENIDKLKKINYEFENNLLFNNKYICTMKRNYLRYKVNCISILLHELNNIKSIRIRNYLKSYSKYNTCFIGDNYFYVNNDFKYTNKIFNILCYHIIYSLYNLCEYDIYSIEQLQNNYNYNYYYCKVVKPIVDFLNTCDIYINQYNLLLINKYNYINDLIDNYINIDNMIYYKNKYWIIYINDYDFSTRFKYITKKDNIIKINTCFFKYETSMIKKYQIDKKLNYNINYIPKLLQVDFSYC